MLAGGIPQAGGVEGIPGVRPEWSSPPPSLLSFPLRQPPPHLNRLRPGGGGFGFFVFFFVFCSCIRLSKCLVHNFVLKAPFWWQARTPWFLGPGKAGGGQKWLNYLHVVLFVFVSKTKTFCGFRNQLEPLAWPC